MIRDLGLLAARVVIGGSMASHGAQKAFGWFGGPGLQGTAKMMRGLGFQPEEPFAAASAYNEVTSGVLMMLGLLGPVGPALLVSQMTVAAMTVHAKNGYFAQNGGVEVPVIYSAAAIALAMSGPGKLSIDAAFGLDESIKAHHAALVLAAGAAGAAAVLAIRNVAPEPGEPA
jgi:putative oxidoreductase